MRRDLVARHHRLWGGARRPDGGFTVADRPGTMTRAAGARKASVAASNRHFCPVAGATTRLRKRAGPRLCRIPIRDHIIAKAI
jgi:hypothetical protein